MQELEPWLDKPTQPTLVSHAAELFEYYARQGDAAFKSSTESTEHFYRVQVEDQIYLISRDDATGTYAVQREDRQSLTESDEQSWEWVGAWLHELESQPAPALHEAAPYWEQQLIQANQILPNMRSLLVLSETQETMTYDEAHQSNLLVSGGYTIGHNLTTDALWLERQGERLVTAQNFMQHQASSQWSLMELDDLGYLNQQDIRYLREWYCWMALTTQLQEVSRQWIEPEPTLQEELYTVPDFQPTSQQGQER